MKYIASSWLMLSAVQLLIQIQIVGLMICTELWVSWNTFTWPVGFSTAFQRPPKVLLYNLIEWPVVKAGQRDCEKVKHSEDRDKETSNYFRQQSLSMECGLNDKNRTKFVHMDAWVVDCKQYDMMVMTRKIQRQTTMITTKHCLRMTIILV